MRLAEENAFRNDILKATGEVERVEGKTKQIPKEAALYHRRARTCLVFSEEDLLAPTRPRLSISRPTGKGGRQVVYSVVIAEKEGYSEGPSQ